MSEKRVRIFPDHPRENHCIGGMTYSRSAGWYPCDAAAERLLGQTLLHEGNPASPKLFQIVSIEEAIAIDKAERAQAQRARKGTARHPVGPNGEMRDDDESELAELRAENALLAERADAAERAQVETNAKLDAILAKLSAAPPLPSNPPPVVEPELPPVVTSAGPLPAQGDAPVVDAARPPARPGASRRARPGAKASALAEPAGEPSAEPPAPTGAELAAAHHDQLLREEGFTIGGKGLPAPPRVEAS